MTFQSQCGKGPGEGSNCIQLGYNCCRMELQTISFPVLHDEMKDHSIDSRWLFTQFIHEKYFCGEGKTMEEDKEPCVNYEGNKVLEELLH